MLVQHATLLHSLELITERQRKTAEYVSSGHWFVCSVSQELEPVILVVLNGLQQFPTVGDIFRIYYQVNLSCHQRFLPNLSSLVKRRGQTKAEVALQ